MSAFPIDELDEIKPAGVSFVAATRLKGALLSFLSDWAFPRLAVEHKIEP